MAQMEVQITIELDIAYQDISEPAGTPPDPITWAATHSCTAVPIKQQACPGGTSYRVTGTSADLERLLADGGYEPLAEQTIIPAEADHHGC